MIAMQYSITLPADYDMDIIRRRIADKGHLLDNSPGLAFKAYLYAARDDNELPDTDNLYAPFYVWRHSESMNDFLSGPGFTGLTHDFGRPSVRIWLPLQTDMANDLSATRYVTRQITTLPQHATLNANRQSDNATQAGLTNGALALVTAFDPTHWAHVRFQLWPNLPAQDVLHDAQLYRVGHVSQPTRKHGIR